MPNREIWMKIKALMAEYEKDFEDLGKDSSKGEKDANDGGQDPVTDLSPEIESEDTEPDNDDDDEETKTKKKAKIAMYGARLKKMGY